MKHNADTECVSAFLRAAHRGQKAALLVCGLSGLNVKICVFIYQLVVLFN